jgi:hypothetical protein
MLPGVRAQLLVSSRSVNPGLVMIQSSVSDDETPTISPGLYHAWKERKQRYKERKQRYFDAFAFYRITNESVARGPLSTAHRKTGSWNVARASSNLFALLGLPVLLATHSLEQNSNLPDVILSFSANPIH